MSRPKMADRNKATLATAVLYGIAVIFLLLVIIGNVNGRSRVLSSIYFFKLDLSNIVPLSVDNAMLLNSVARSMGLHDFYQVGLWNFCEGYNDEGITFCSQPRRFFWFNPVEVILSELLAGARVAIPERVTQILHLLKLAQQLMFGFFIAGIVLAAVLLVGATPLVPRSRWWSLPAGLIGFLAALFTSAATVLASVMSVAAKIALSSQKDLNISADIGRPMFAFMWIATICVDTAAVFHMAMGCFCAPPHERRRRAQASSLPAGEESADGQPVSEKRRRLPDFFVKRRKNNGGAGENPPPPAAPPPERAYA